MPRLFTGISFRLTLVNSVGTDRLRNSAACSMVNKSSLGRWEFCNLFSSNRSLIQSTFSCSVLMASGSSSNVYFISGIFCFDNATLAACFVGLQHVKPYPHHFPTNIYCFFCFGLSEPEKELCLSSLPLKLVICKPWYRKI